MKSSIKVSQKNNKENESAKQNPIIENIKVNIFYQKYLILFQRRKNLKLLGTIKEYKKG